MGVNATVASVRQEYWVPQLRQLYKSVIHHCIICKKTQGRPYRVNIAPPLLEFRVQRKQPFSVTGVDYTGALLTKEKQQNPEEAYIVLFTCPVTTGIHIKLKVIGPAFLSFSELSCVVTELEAIINDRPLSYTSRDLNQLDILTPNHLILGRRLRSFPREVIDWKDETKDPLYGGNKDVGKRFLYITKKCDDLWKRREREYLTSLRETHRVGIRHESWPKMGDVVLIHDGGPRSRWKFGQIVKLHVGPDDVFRMVTLKTPQGETCCQVISFGIMARD
ncbi:uncharacterized protein [Palaemon carinicauda]|uniref:uncharacterized protein n=1 Tax=Palaemon carinicauda TaxID=392227 RepID=UPI0035B5A4B7